MLSAFRILTKDATQKSCRFFSSSPSSSKKPEDDSKVVASTLVFAVFSLLVTGLNIMRKEWVREPRIKHDLDSWMLHLKTMEAEKTNNDSAQASDKKEKKDLSPKLR